MAKGAGMIHPRLATMLVVITTDYPLAPGEPESFLRPAVARSFNRISVDGDCSTNDAVVLLANGASGAARDDEAFAAALDEVCTDLARQVVADGEGATVVLEIGVTGAATTAEAEAIARRIATSPLVKTAAFGHDPNWGRVLMAAGSAPFGDGFAQLDTDRLTVAFDGVAVFVDGAPTGSGPGALRRGLPDRPSARSRRRRRRLPRLRPHLRLRAHQRGVHDVSRIVLKLGGRVAAAAAAEALALRAQGHDVVVVHGAGPQITAEMERRGIAPIVRRRPARDDGRGARGRPRLARRGQRRGLRRDRRRRPCRSSATRSGFRPSRWRRSGSSATRLPSAPPAVVEALAAGRIPVVAPLAASRRASLNVNADEAAAALAVGLGAERIVFVSDVPGVLMEGAVIEHIAVDDADRMLGDGTFEGGIVPKLEAAVLATRGGVRASIGATEVVA